MIPYTQHTVEQDDLDAVANALRDGDLCTGRIVERYEAQFASCHGYAHGVAVNSGTAALWCALKTFGLRRGDEVITSPLTFAATANMIVAVGARPVFADVDAGTFNINYQTVIESATKRTQLIVPVDFGGQLANVGRPRYIEPTSAQDGILPQIPVVVDAAHSVGVPTDVGVIRCYSTHAAKNMTTCEGGMVLTNDGERADHIRSLRNHGINSDYRARKSHRYSMDTIGFNFRLPDPLAALGISQLSKLSQFNTQRGVIRAQYDTAFNGEPGIILRKGAVPSSNHLYVILLDLNVLKYDRDYVFRKLRKANVGVNVHYKPVYLFRPYRRMGFQPGLCPNAEWVYERVMTLPMYPTMEVWQVEYVISTVKSVIGGCLK